MAEKGKLGGKPGRWGAIAGWRAGGAVAKLDCDGRLNCARRICAADAGWEKEATWRGVGVEDACLGRVPKQKVQHPAFPRGPPPQYCLDSTPLNCAVRMGSGEPG